MLVCAGPRGLIPTFAACLRDARVQISGSLAAIGGKCRRRNTGNHFSHLLLIATDQFGSWGALAMFAGLFRIVLGIVIACLVAGAVQVAFAYSPTALAAAGWEAWEFAGWRTLQAATASALIATPFLLVGGSFSELFGIRSFAFHVLVGILIGVSGFAILYSGQLPDQRTLANSYALAAFLTTGFMGGIAYWLAAGRFAGGRRYAANADQAQRAAITQDAPESRRMITASVSPATVHHRPSTPVTAGRTGS